MFLFFFSPSEQEVFMMNYSEKKMETDIHHLEKVRNKSLQLSEKSAVYCMSDFRDEAMREKAAEIINQDTVTQ